MATATTTLQDVRDSVYAQLAEPEDSDVYPLSRIDELINEGQRQSLSRVKMFFMEADPVQYQIVPDVVTSAAIATTDVTIDLSDASDYPTSGTIEIEGDIIAYTGKSGNQLTGVTGITIDHATNKNVKFLYDLPSDADPTGVTQVMVAQSVYEYRDFRDFTEMGISQTQQLSNSASQEEGIYTIFRDKIRIIKQSDATRILTIRFYKIPATLVDGGDVLEIPDEFALPLIREYVLYKIYKATDDIENSQIAQQEYNSQFELMRARYARRVEKLNPAIRSVYQRYGLPAARRYKRGYDGPRQTA